MNDENENPKYDAYNAFMLRHRETVWQACWRFAKGDYERCRDMVQEVYLTLWLHFDELDENYNELQQRVWVKRVTRSVLVDLYRRSGPEMERITDDMVENVADRTQDVAETADYMMSVLNADERRLLQMRIEGYETQEIAEELGINRNALYQRMNRMITKLRKHGRLL